MFAGYFDKPAQTARAFQRRAGSAPVTSGSWKTGTCGFSARVTEVVISGGHNVYPAEVEDVLLAYPDVAEVAVSGTPSDEWGEVVTAWVVTASGKLDVEGLLVPRCGRARPLQEAADRAAGRHACRATRWARSCAGARLSCGSTDRAATSRSTRRHRRLAMRIAFGTDEQTPLTAAMRAHLEQVGPRGHRRRERAKSGPRSGVPWGGRREPARRSAASCAATPAPGSPWRRTR